MLTWRTWACGLLLTTALVAGGCTLFPGTGKGGKAPVQLTAAREAAIGKQVFALAVQRLGGEYADPQLAAYLNRVGLSLARAGSRPDLSYHFTVVNDSDPNAFVLPGGFVLVTRGLLEQMDSEAELAALLGNEIGCLSTQETVLLFSQGDIAGRARSLLAPASGQSAFGRRARQAVALTEDLLDRGCGEVALQQAERLGIDAMVRAGYDPAGELQLQSLFARQNEEGNARWRSFFRTHPFSSERMRQDAAYIRRRYAATLHNPRYALRPQALQDALAGLRRNAAGYALYDRARRLEADGKLSAAVTIYLEAAAAAPEQPLILTRLGLVYLKVGDLTAAHLHLGRAVYLNGNYYDSRLGLGYVYLAQKKPAAAVRELEKSMQLYPTPQGGYLLAEGYAQLARPSQAIPLYRAVAAADPGGKLGRSAARQLRLLEGR